MQGCAAIHEKRTNKAQKSPEKRSKDKTTTGNRKGPRIPPGEANTKNMLAQESAKEPRKAQESQ